MPVIDVKHPLVKHKVGLLREDMISTKKFRELTNELARLLAYEAPNPSTQKSCVTYTDFVQTGTGEWGQALGDGCVYPAGVLTIGDQLIAAGLTWKAYGEDMAASPTAPATCRHPEIGTEDTTLL